MDVWNYILGYRNTLKSVFETWVVHIPFNLRLFTVRIWKQSATQCNHLHDQF